MTQSNPNLPEQSGNCKEIFELTALISAMGAGLLSNEIEDLKIEMGLFLGEYNSKVGDLYVELDRVKLQILEYELRKKIAESAELDESGKDIEEEVSEAFANEREKIEQMENEASESSKKREENIEREKHRSGLDENIAGEIKKIYRELASKFHPGRAKDEESKLKNQEVMKKINVAYEEGDLETLKKYRRQADEEEKVERETPEENFERLKSEYKDVLKLVEKLQPELQNLKESDTYKLKERVKEAKELGKDVLAELVEKLKGEIEENQAILQGRIAEYEEALP